MTAGDPLAAIRLRHDVARDVGSAYYPAEDMGWLIGEVERLRVQLDTARNELTYARYGEETLRKLRNEWKRCAEQAEAERDAAVERLGKMLEEGT